jgi:hypothetical protein
VDHLMENPRALWERLLAPRLGFQARAGERPGLWEAVRGLLLARTLPALAGLILGYLGFVQGLSRALRMEGPLWDQVWSRLPAQVSPADLRAMTQNLPPLWSLGRVLPWLVLLAPVGVLSIWLHDAVWDHMALWLLRGLGGPGRFRVTLVADAEALKVGAIGAVGGLLKFLPGAGPGFTVLLALAGIWFWILRGYALAAWHGCPVWKGVLATLLHALIMAVMVFGTLAMFAVLVLQELRMS